MSTARSVFTEAIEDHLALKKQNTALEAAMPLARYDVGDPLDRYPGGPGRAAEGTVVVTEELGGDAPEAAAELEAPAATEATQVLVGPSPEQAIESATALEPTFTDRPFEPLTGMAPMLSLVEDIEEEEDVAAAPASADALQSGDVLRFPGGVGPREQGEPSEMELQGQLSVETEVFSAPDPALGASVPVADDLEQDAPTGEQPVIVIDADEPLASSDWSEPVEPTREPRRKPRFFGLRRRKADDDSTADGWFKDGPRDFNWD